MLFPQAGHWSLPVGQGGLGGGRFPKWFYFCCCCFVCLFSPFPWEKEKKRTNEKGNLSMQRHLDGLSQHGDLGCDTGCVWFIWCWFFFFHKASSFPSAPGPVLSPVTAALVHWFLGRVSGCWIPPAVTWQWELSFFFVFCFKFFFFKSQGEHLPENQGFLPFVTSRTLQELKKRKQKSQHLLGFAGRWEWFVPGILGQCCPSCRGRSPLSPLRFSRCSCVISMSIFLFLLLSRKYLRWIFSSHRPLRCSFQWDFKRDE